MRQLAAPASTAAGRANDASQNAAPSLERIRD